MKPLKPLSLILLGIIWSFSSIGQSDPWTLYNTDNSGLPSDYVRAIAQEDECTFWFGTAGGVGKFDGAEWTTYDTSNSGLPHNQVRSIVIDGHIKWFGTFGGLVRFNDTTWTIYDELNSLLPENKILHVSEGQGGYLWIGTTGNITNTIGGAIRFNKSNEWIIYDISNSGIVHNNVRTINATDSTDIWIGTLEGVSRKIGSLWIEYTTDNSPLPFNDCPDIKKDSLGNVYMGTYSGGGPAGGIAKYDGMNWSIFDTSNTSMTANSVGTIHIDECGVLWCGNHFLQSFDGELWTPFDTVNSPLPDFNIAIVTQDSRGRNWIGSINKGIAVFQNDCEEEVEIDCPQEPIGLHTDLELERFVFYPNPSSDHLRHSYGNSAELNTIEIYNLFGQLLLRTRAERNQPINISHIPVGSYVGRLYFDGLNESIQQLIIIQ